MRTGHCRAQQGWVVGENERVLESLPQSASSRVCYQLHRTLVLKPTLAALGKIFWGFAPRLQRAALAGF